MLKRTIGRFLLTILVITGLAGTSSNNSLTKPERKKALSLMKDSRSEFLAGIQDLKKSQLNYRSSPGNWNIKEHIFHITASEQQLWDLLKKAMEHPASPACRAEVKLSDEELISSVEDPANAAFDPFTGKEKNYRSVESALNAFKKQRTEHIKYLRTSTEDLRNHVVTLSFGTIDCYQLCLLIASHTSRHLRQIEQIRSQTYFPK